MSQSARSYPVRMLGRHLAAGWALACMLGGGAMADAPSHPPKSSPEHPQISVASLGGGLQDAQQATLFGPFSQQSGVTVQARSWDGSLDTVRGRAQTGNENWDLALMEEAPLRLACREGLFVSKPLTADPATTAPDSTGRDCGVGAGRMNLLLAWDASRVDMVPTWADFWDVARRPGKRGLRRDPRSTLEIALMADGVAPDDVYRTLGTAEGVDRAFRKLDQLKPYIVWWNTPVEAVQIIESGAVLMTSAPQGEVATADQTGHRHFGTQWEQSLGVNLSWGMLRTATPEPTRPDPAKPAATSPGRRALAQQLLAYMADPARRAAFQAAYPAIMATPPAGVPLPDTAPAAPTSAPAATPVPAPAAAADGAGDHQATLMMDDGFWVDHLLALRQRFDTWLAAK